MTGRDWHVDEALMGRYLSGDADLAVGASVEAHLMACGDCRGRLARQSGPATDPVMERAWTAVVAGVGSPRPSRPVRLMRRLGVSDADAVLLNAARSLDGSWAIATMLVIAFAALAALGDATGGRALYLLIAPLVPVIGVVVAFASTDPFDELTAATPYPAARLALLRTAAVCVTSVPIVVVIGAAVPALGWLAVAWLVPAIALTLLALAAMTWVSPAAAGAGAAALWTTVLVGARLVDEAPAAVAPQMLAAQFAVAALATACLIVRLRNAHAPGGPR